MEIISRSFRLDRGSSIRLGRSNSSLLVTELESSEVGKITAYERLSDSMRLTADERAGYRRRRRTSRSWAFLSKAFSFWKTGGEGVKGRPVAEKAGKLPEAAAVEGRRKTRSSYIPDPHRRWPVQGW